jgi:prepilin-type processing-associated H-X9-DG protein
VVAHPKSAVISTRPKDLVIYLKDPAAALRDRPDGGFNAALCDGSVRFIKATIELETLLSLLQMNDGQVIREF